MRVLFALGSIRHVRHWADTLRELCDEGHTVRIVIDRIQRANTSDRSLRELLAEHGNCSYETMATPRRTPNYRVQRRLRDLLNYGIYFEPGHPSRCRAELARQKMHGWARKVAANPVGGRVLVSRPFRRAVAAALTRFPVDPEVTAQVQSFNPDVVFASPVILQHSSEVEYLRAAKALGIPTVTGVLSWDNLTTKGAFHAAADITLVWNRALLEEAVSLHHLSRKRLAITGAPPFDFWFRPRHSAGRESFCRQAGIDPDQPYFVYLCSSHSIAADEADFVRELAKAMRSHPLGRRVTMLVRPHPTNSEMWDGFEEERVVVWPSSGEWPDTEESQQLYYDTLHHSMAAMGINTSAFLEAACVDKPCVTVLTPRYAATQSGIGHFQHLLNGGFLETARSVEEALEIIAAIDSGRDAKAENRRRFVKDFIRPCGCDRRASSIVVGALRAVAEGDRAPKTRSPRPVERVAPSAQEAS